MRDLSSVRKEVEQIISACLRTQSIPSDTEFVFMVMPMYMGQSMKILYKKHRIIMFPVLYVLDQLCL